ncbi:unnamed protein product [Owenia fusiformis]|uniref:Uncharacterized protein n=1 Tax=Owenia fusiformis TaxID=6347 RepID=A0A8J1U0G9_OWEFU|nr:unnamed protein product [Owenia fusiformis]
MESEQPESDSSSGAKGQPIRRSLRSRKKSSSHDICGPRNELENMRNSEVKTSRTKCKADIVVSHKMNLRKRKLSLGDVKTEPREIAGPSTRKRANSVGFVALNKTDYQVQNRVKPTRKISGAAATILSEESKKVAKIKPAQNKQLDKRHVHLNDKEDFLKMLSLEMLCRILNYLSIYDVMKLDCLSSQLHQAVNLHLRVRKWIDFTPGDLYGTGPRGFNDATFLSFMQRCKDLEYIYGFHVPVLVKRKQYPKKCLSIPGAIKGLCCLENLKGIEISDIFLLSAILNLLPHVQVLKAFRNRNGGFPIPETNKLELKPAARVTTLDLTGVVISTVPRLEHTKHLLLNWVKLTDPNPFKDVVFPNLETFVMKNCAGPNNALKYLTLMTALAAARNLHRLELGRVPFLGGLIQHLVEDSRRSRGYRSLRKIVLASCKHALEVDLGYMMLTCAAVLEEVHIQPSISRDSMFSALILAEAIFPQFTTLTIGYVDDFPQHGKWTNEELVKLGLADVAESPAMVTDIGVRAAGQALPSMKHLKIYNCPHLHTPTSWFNQGNSGLTNLTELHLHRCHAIQLPDFCRMITLLPSIANVILEQMFREPPKGCARVGLSAGTGLGVSAALVANNTTAPTVPDNNNNDDDDGDNGGHSDDEHVGEEGYLDYDEVPDEMIAEEQLVDDLIADELIADNMYEDERIIVREESAQRGDVDNKSLDENLELSSHHVRSSENPNQVAEDKEQNHKNQNNELVQIEENNQAKDQPEKGMEPIQLTYNNDLSKEPIVKDKNPKKVQHNVSDEVIIDMPDGSKHKVEEVMEHEPTQAETIDSKQDDLQKSQIINPNEYASRKNSNLENKTLNQIDGDFENEHIVKPETSSIKPNDDTCITLETELPVVEGHMKMEHTDDNTKNEEYITLQLASDDDCITVETSVDIDDENEHIGTDTINAIPDKTEDVYISPGPTEKIIQIDNLKRPEPQMIEPNEPYITIESVEIETSPTIDMESTNEIVPTTNESLSTHEKASPNSNNEKYREPPNDLIDQEYGKVDENSDDELVSAFNIDDMTGDEPIIVIKADFDCKPMPSASVSDVDNTIKQKKEAPSGSIEHKTMVTDSTGKQVEIKEQIPVGGKVPKGETLVRGSSGKTNGKSVYGKKKGLVKKRSKISETSCNMSSNQVSQSCQAVSEEIREETKVVKDDQKSAKTVRKESKGCNTDPPFCPRCKNCNPDLKTTQPEEDTEKPKASDDKPDNGCNDCKDPIEERIGSTSDKSNQSKEDSGLSKSKPSKKNSNNHQSLGGMLARGMGEDIDDTLDGSVHDVPQGGASHTTCDQSTSTSDPVIEEDHEQVMTLESKTLQNLTLRDVGITDLIMNDCKELRSLSGNGCRVLKFVSIHNSNTSLERVSFAQCRKLDHRHLLWEVSRSPSYKDRLVFLRPMRDYDPVEIERTLFSSWIVDYNLCLIHDHSPSPSGTFPLRHKLENWLEIAADINQHILHHMDFPERKLDFNHPRYPWGRNMYTMRGNAENGSPYEVLTDIPWIRALQEMGVDNSLVDFMGRIGSPYDYGALFECWDKDELHELICDLSKEQTGVHACSVGVYINLCDLDKEPAHDMYL